MKSGRTLFERFGATSAAESELTVERQRREMGVDEMAGWLVGVGDRLMREEGST